MSDIYHRHVLSDGLPVWLQRVKISGIRKPQWSLVEMTGHEFADAPRITPLRDEAHGLELLADILKADVLEPKTISTRFAAKSKAKALPWFRPRNPPPS